MSDIIVAWSDHRPVCRGKKAKLFFTEWWGLMRKPSMSRSCITHSVLKFVPTWLLPVAFSFWLRALLLKAVFNWRLPYGRPSLVPLRGSFVQPLLFSFCLVQSFLPFQRQLRCQAVLEQFKPLLNIICCFQNPHSDRRCSQESNLSALKLLSDISSVLLVGLHCTVSICALGNEGLVLPAVGPHTFPVEWN